MKNIEIKYKVLSNIIIIISTVLFVLFGIFLMFENPDPGIGDTSLFFMDGGSVGLQGYTDLVSIQPLVVYVLYAICLFVVVISLIKRLSLVVIPFINIILSIPVIIVHYKTLLFKPFHYDVFTGYSREVLKWVWFAWLSVIVLILLLIYVISKNASALTNNFSLPNRIKK